MKSARVEEIEAEIAFAKQAAEAFSGDPRMASYGEIERGSFLALRWGLGNDCVVVLKLDEYHTPTNYHNLVTPKVD